MGAYRTDSECGVVASTREPQHDGRAVRIDKQALPHTGLEPRPIHPDKHTRAVIRFECRVAVSKHDRWADLSGLHHDFVLGLRIDRLEEDHRVRDEWPGVKGDIVPVPKVRQEGRHVVRIRVEVNRTDHHPSMTAIVFPPMSGPQTRAWHPGLQLALEQAEGASTGEGGARAATG